MRTRREGFSVVSAAEGEDDSWFEGFYDGYPAGYRDAVAGNKKSPPERDGSRYNAGYRNGYLTGFKLGRLVSGN